MSQLHVFDSVVDEIIANKKIKDEGGQIGIPYPFPSLNRNLGAIQRGSVIGVTANSGVSKSKFTRFVYIYNVYNFYKRTGYNVKILYFPLEDSHNEVVYNMICFYLKDKYDMNVSVQHLYQLGDYDLNTYTIKRIQEARGYFSDLYNILEVFDSSSTTTEMNYNVESWAAKNGIITKNDKGEIIGYKLLTGAHTIEIIDNLSNITPEAKHGYGDKSAHNAIGELAHHYARKVWSKIFDHTVVLVQQQSQGKEKVQFAQNGRQLYEKYEPSLGDLADNLTVQRSFHVAFGIFSPERYPDLHEYWGYDIAVLGSFFRSVKILKSNRSGSTGKIIPLWFEGSSEHYEEMPQTNKVNGNWVISEELQRYYDRAKNIRDRKVNYQLEL